MRGDREYVLDLEGPISKYYAAFPDPDYSRSVQVVETELDDIFLQASDRDYAADKWRQTIESIYSNSDPLEPHEVHQLRAAETLGLEVIEYLNQNGLYNDDGSIKGIFDRYEHGMVVLTTVGVGP